LLIIAALWYLWYILFCHVSAIEPIKGFDPYELLGLEPGVSVAQIRRTYRHLSLAVHPDKNPDDPFAH